MNSIDNFMQKERDLNETNDHFEQNWD